MVDLLDFKRDQIVGARMEGASVTNNAEFFGVASSTISKVTTEFEENGKTPSLKQNSERKRKLFDWDRRTHMRIKKDHKNTALKITAELNDHLKNSLSSKTVRRDLHRAGFLFLRCLQGDTLGPFLGVLQGNKMAPFFGVLQGDTMAQFLGDLQGDTMLPFLGVLQGSTMAPFLSIICLDFVLQTSVAPMNEKDFLQKGKKYTISSRNYYWCRLREWSWASFKHTCSRKISAT